MLAIGSTTEVDCTATDAIGNESDVSTFEVFVGLNVGGEEDRPKVPDFVQEFKIQYALGYPDDELAAAVFAS